MSAALHIVVPWDINRTNPNRMMSMHWAAKGRLVKRARQTARQAWEGAGRPVATLPVRLSVIVRRGRKIDQGNVWAALKPLIDGVFVQALTPDDGERWLVLGSITQEAGKRWVGREEVEFVIEPVGVA